MHARGDAQDTPERSLYPTSRGATCWSDHLRPFQRSASAIGVDCGPAVSEYVPTAVQAVAETHDTALKPLSTAPTGLGPVG